VFQLSRRTIRASCALLSSVAALGAVVLLQAQRGSGAQPPAPARDAAPIDLTGYWVSVVTQDWRWRMVTPAKGDYLNIPMTQEAKRVADTWDPAKDEAAGEQCRSYGAPGLMSVPGRLHIGWQDDNTLRVETDAGQQTRLLHFGSWQPQRNTVASWQGSSIARWDRPRGNVPLMLRPAIRRAGQDPDLTPKGGSMHVVTTNLRPGYLRKNGVPYSGNAVLTEEWDLFTWRTGEQWLTITTQTEDPQYLREPRLIALQFKKEANGAKWDPSPCSARW
jgi:hypothetical protein